MGNCFSLSGKASRESNIIPRERLIRNVPPEFLDGMGSYSMSTSLYSHHQIGHRNGGQNGSNPGNPINELPAQTIITNQPLSVQTISSTLQLEAKSTVEALIHQPTHTHTNHVHPRKDHVLAITTPCANHHGDKSVLITCAKHDCLQVSDNGDFAKENNHKMVSIPNRQDRPSAATEDQEQSEIPRLQLTNGVIKDSPDKDPPPTFVSTANSLALDARLIIEETLNKNGGLFVESGNGHHVMLDIGKVRLLREILKEASFSDQEEVLSAPDAIATLSSCTEHESSTQSQTGAAQIKVETTATQPELSSEAKPATTLAPSSGGGGTTNSITSSVSLSDQKNPTEKSDQKVVTIENSASAAPCALPTTTLLSEKKPLTSDHNTNEIHDFDGAAQGSVNNFPIIKKVDVEPITFLPLPNVELVDQQENVVNNDQIACEKKSIPSSLEFEESDFIAPLESDESPDLDEFSRSSRRLSILPEENEAEDCLSTSSNSNENGGSHLPRQQHRGPAQLQRDSAGSNSTSGGSGVGLRNSFRRAQSAEDTEDREKDGQSPKSIKSLTSKSMDRISATEILSNGSPAKLQFAKSTSRVISRPSNQTEGVDEDFDMTSTDSRIKFMDEEDSTSSEEDETSETNNAQKEPTSVLSRSVAFDLNNDISEEAEEIKPPEVPVSNSASPQPESKSPTQIQIHRQKKVTPIPRQLVGILKPTTDVTLKSFPNLPETFLQRLGIHNKWIPGER
jgi:hypothetical protein